MSKNKFGIPGILFSPTPTPGPTGVIGGGSNQGSQGHNDLPMTFEAFCADTELWQFIDDMNENGDPGIADWYDYGLWWSECNFTLDQWKALKYSEEDYNTYVAINQF